MENPEDEETLAVVVVAADSTDGSVDRGGMLGCPESGEWEDRLCPACNINIYAIWLHGRLEDLEQSIARGWICVFR